MRSKKTLSFACALLAVGVTAIAAFACPNNDKSASQASYSSVAKADCPASKDCPASACAHGAKSASEVSLTSAEHMNCGMSKSAMAAKGECSMHGASAMACSFGKNRVTMSGDLCPTAHEADYAFAVKGADCQGSSEEAVKAIHSVKGVTAVTVDYANHMAYVCADNRTATQASITSSLKKAGFDNVKFVSQNKANCAKSHGKIEA